MGPITATFSPPLAAGSTVSVDVQTRADAPQPSLRLFDANNVQLAAVTGITSSVGVCPTNTATNRGTVTLSATADGGPVAYAIVDVGGGFVFVIDNFRMQ